MASSFRGSRVLKAIEMYVKENSNNFDSAVILNKIKLSSLSEGNLKGSFIVEAGMCNALRTLHGGYISSVIDVACLFAQLSNTNGKIAWTTNLYVTFLDSAKEGETITVETKTLRGGINPIMEAYLRKESGAIISKGTVSYIAGNERLQKTLQAVLKLDPNEE